MASWERSTSIRASVPAVIVTLRRTGSNSGCVSTRSCRPASTLVRSGVLTALGSVVLAVPRRLTGHSLRPFAIGGFGLIRARSDDVLNVYNVEANLMGLRIGGGAIGMLSETVGLRFDLSHIRTLKGQGNEGEAFGSRSLSFWRASTAAVLRF